MQNKQVSSWEERRKKLLAILSDHEDGITIRDVMDQTEYLTPKDLVIDLKNLSPSLRNEGRIVMIRPAECLRCGFVFKQSEYDEKVPSKCPRCKEQKISLPSVKIAED